VRKERGGRGGEERERRRENREERRGGERREEGERRIHHTTTPTGMLFLYTPLTTLINKIKKVTATTLMPSVLSLLLYTVRIKYIPKCHFFLFFLLFFSCFSSIFLLSFLFFPSFSPSYPLLLETHQSWP
jgi:hypothetical protein